MRKFAFRLQRALRFSLLRESQSKTQIAAVLQRISFLDKYTTKLEAKIRTAIEMSTQGINTLEGDAHRHAIVPTIEENRRILSLRVEELAALEKKQRELKRLSQRRRSLESLKEKHILEFRLEKTRKEQKGIDEMVQLRRARALTSPGDRD
jgi:flagellar export protein FliJ